MAYADDMTIVSWHDTEVGMVQKCKQTMDRVDHWMGQHGLTLSPEKTEIVVFLTRKKRKSSFKLRGTVVEPIMTAKYLGVTLDKYLTFGSHIQEQRRHWLG